MEFSDLSAADAELYRAVIEEDGPIRLAELAQLLRADGMDLDQFDGSMESLVPLWSWFIDFARADFPGVPDDARSRLAIVEESDRSTSRARYASEFLMHYIFKVARGYLTEVRWVVETRQNMMSTHETHAQFTMDSGKSIPFDLGLWCEQTALALILGHATVIPPDSLLNRARKNVFNFGLAMNERIRNTPRSGVSVLEGLGEPGPRRPPLTLVSVAESFELNTAESSDDEPVGDELILAAPDTDVENLENARSLDAGAVAKTLTSLGFVTSEGESITAAVILAEEMAEFMRADHEVAVFATAAYGGRLRAVHVDSINPTKAQWQAVMTALQTLASSLNAKLAREDEFDFFEDE
ncbi:hypothetical protein I6E68_06505 [Salinibacterium sp. NSLL150]|uniref:hypothetical protein n=1 Tax=unclassified Salinibacterium TaxID=2632331 RepID=UPI0018CF054E|nr:MULTISPECIES: hypothetical protein [unclassified Salinibacterium]MBH0098787.1 hypothetical protein [Salinibacterium sp. NSLL35]MBH0101542.1 hypothetical protein [Salinibacterium sp. NSLL150]MBH0104301.1 hypothetical protein [Salinibacterium sp. NSLL16]MBH0107062.1 hypothetical protein [Salinibacterium sp. NSLL17]